MIHISISSLCISMQKSLSPCRRVKELLKFNSIFGRLEHSGPVLSATAPDASGPTRMRVGGASVAWMDRGRSKPSMGLGLGRGYHGEGHSRCSSKLRGERSRLRSSGVCRQAGNSTAPAAHARLVERGGWGLVLEDKQCGLSVRRDRRNMDMCDGRELIGGASVLKCRVFT